MIEKTLNAIIILITLCSGLLTSNLFADKIIYPKQAAALMLIFVNLALMGVILKNRYKTDILYTITFVFILYLLVHSVIFCSSCSYRFLFQLIGFFILYSCFYFNKPKIRADYFHDALCLTGIVQSIIAILQLPKYNSIFGTSDNPTGLAISLVFIFPFVYSNYKTIQANWKRTIYVISLGLIMLTIVLSGCRACIIALAVIVSFMICSKKSIILLVGVSTTLLLTICYKKDSSRGRFFIYQTSTQMLDSQTLIFGKGHGGFKKEYMFFQARTFENKTQNYNAILADNVSHPLNEYLLLLIEHGISGCIFVFIIGLLFFKYADRSSPHFLFMMALGIIACFSYPFRYPLTFVLLAYSLAAVDCKKTYNLKIPKSFKIAIVFCAIWGVLYMLRDMRNNYLWKKQITLCSLGKTEKALPKYNELYVSMNDNPYFLYNYSMVLFKSGNYEKSVNVLSHCNQYLNDYDTELLHADVSWTLKQFNEAEYHYIHASRMCPNRFQPFYQLMNLYKDIGKMSQARCMAEIIIQKEVKIPSVQIDNMIREANSFLNNHPY